ncbi:mitochondrial ribonuclease P catalytic subunit [Plodia interpunctella]|uniref:mitochondrial ribonuclease P catalytic subunit n=1 Tax=Plodia interpunctella TaxID=58824 RepID=UPI00236801F9|nr:mitochondrial ribonuclease P catalytic subunit [Plodia interpunctella]
MSLGRYRYRWAILIEVTMTTTFMTSTLAWHVVFNPFMKTFHVNVYFLYLFSYFIYKPIFKFINDKIMYRSIFRTVNATCISYNLSVRCVKKAAVVISGRYATDQISFLQAEIDNTVKDWASLKSDTLTIPGSINEKNIDAIILKVMVTSKKFEAATSFAEYLKQPKKELTIGVKNGLLSLYYELAKIRNLTEEEKKFILLSYNKLYTKYKVLDTITCERLLHALCAINEYKKADKVLRDIHLSGKPTHSAYSTLIAALFRNNKNTEAMKLIDESVNMNRPLRHDAYESWINYVLRKYKDKKSILKCLEDICQHVSKNLVTLNTQSAEIFYRMYSSAGWNVDYTRFRKQDGQCIICKERLTPLKLSDEEFLKLQKVIKEKLIVGSDLFLKTSPEELQRFTQFVEKTGPYDIVLDALNIAFSARGGSRDKLVVLHAVVDRFRQKKLKILVLGRKHMMTWQRRSIQELTSKACCFFTDDLTQDDPYFITAAILSGAHTDIVSKDLLRGHRFKLQDDELGIIFRRWQWQHQWMVFINKFGKLIFQEPLKLDPYPQKNASSWHIPYQKEQDEDTAYFNDGTPNLDSWLCLRPRIKC